MTAPIHDSIALARLMRKLFPSESVACVWEIGSRDGRDALQLSKAFPQASVYAFEPNPETFPAVQGSARGSNGRVRAVNVALTGADGPVEFMQIDTMKTKTVRSDGNPGASSLFSASVFGGGPQADDGAQAFAGALATQIVLLKGFDPESRGIVERANGYFETLFRPA